MDTRALGNHSVRTAVGTQSSVAMDFLFTACNWMGAGRHRGVVVGAWCNGRAVLASLVWERAAAAPVLGMGFLRVGLERRVLVAQSWGRRSVVTQRIAKVSPARCIDASVLC